MIIRSFPLPGAHDLVSVAGAELSHPHPLQQKQSVDGRWGRRRWCKGDRSPRSMGEGRGRGECPLVLAFMVCPAHTESSAGGPVSPLPALAFHSLQARQVVKPEDRGGPEQDSAQGVSELRALGVSDLRHSLSPIQSAHVGLSPTLVLQTHPVTHSPRYTLPKTQLHTHTHPSSLTRLPVTPICRDMLLPTRMHTESHRTTVPHGMSQVPRGMDMHCHSFACDPCGPQEQCALTHA